MTDNANICPFARFDGQLVEFLHLPLEPLALDQHIFRIGFIVFALARQSSPRFIGCRDSRHVGLAATGLVVQQHTLRIKFQQRLMRMLAMDVDQQITQLAQLRSRRRHAVDVGLGAPGIVDHAAQQRPALVRHQVVLGQPHGGRFGNGKVGRDVGAGRAFTHHAGVAAPAQRQLQRVDQDRLAGAGLSRKDGKTRGKLELDRVDNDEIANGERTQHKGRYS
jgi:hypothetical protein